MTEQTTTEGARCRVGRATGNPCPRPATVNAWGDGPPEICEYHNELWDLSNDLGQTETAQEMLALWQRQADIVGCPPLEDAMRYVKVEADLEVARLKREIAALEERAGG